MNLGLDGKIVLVTGGAKGIGEGITRAFAAEGAIVCIVGRNPAEAIAIIDSEAVHGRLVESYHADMTDAASLELAVSSIVERHGRLDILVNNAGGNDAVGLRHGPDSFRRSLETNLIPVYTLVHLSIDHLIASKGNIVNIGSKCSVTGQGGTSGYAASKGAMNALTREWAVDLSRYGVRVNCILPAEVITPLYERWLAAAPDPKSALKQLNETIPLGRRTTTVAEIADTVLFLASERSSHTTGQLFFVDGGYVHLDRACTQPSSHLKSS